LLEETNITWDVDTWTTDVNFIYAEKTNIPVVSIYRVCFFPLFFCFCFCLRLVFWGVFVLFIFVLFLLLFFFLDLCRRASKRISVNVNGLIRFVLFVCLFDGVQRHFQQYFSYIVTVSFICGGPGENHRPVASHWQTIW
jgi:hypothetical protein